MTEHVTASPVGDDAEDPAWKRQTAAEQRWPVALVLIVTIAIEFALPSELETFPKWVAPAIELVLLAALLLANPGRIRHGDRVMRIGGLVLAAILTFGNIHQAIRLISDIFSSAEEFDAAELLAAGAGVWLTNIVVFALWYWELDRGGPGARAAGHREHPDFLFTQMGVAYAHSPKDWEPTFFDYLYLSFTNATAFSPADTLPMSRWAKMLMMVQSAVSVCIVTVVVARAIGLFS